MSISFSSNFDDFQKNLETQVRDRAEEGLAQRLVEVASEEGLDSVDKIDLKLDADSRKLGIDRERVYRLARSKSGTLGSQLPLSSPLTAGGGLASLSD